VRVKRVRLIAAAVAIGALLLAPAVWAVDTLGHATSGTFPEGGPANVQGAGGGFGGRGGFGGPGGRGGAPHAGGGTRRGFGPGAAAGGFGGYGGGGAIGAPIGNDRTI